MPLPAGTHIAHFEITGLIGAGAMGEVYRARDSRLRRDVAIKILPEQFLADADRRARFAREAALLASLNHPNIATVLGLEEWNGLQALLMEYVDGPTLQDLIQRHASASPPSGLAPGQALRIASQIAEALQSAHAGGIVHRDLKPANIKVRPDGTVKVLDFGLAKVFDAAAGMTGIDATMTAGGQFVGTPAYASPEQVFGKPVDARADIWAFGCVLYEMLSGRRAFAGRTLSDVLEQVIKIDPDYSALGGHTPASVVELVKRCLEKAPGDRPSIAEARAALLDAGDALRRPSGEAPAVGRRHAWPGHALVGILLLLVLVAAGTLGVWWYQGSRESWARREAIPEVARLVERGELEAAFALANEARRYVTDDPLLRSLEPQFAIAVAITSDPAGADVYVRAYDTPDEEWQRLGQTPLENVSLPRRASRWRIEKTGFVTAERASTAETAAIDATLHAADVHPPGMVFVPGGRSVRAVNSTRLPAVTMPPYFLDRVEVTNREFKEFIDAGGYSRAELWDGLRFTDGTSTLSRSAAVARFVDATGRPGPAAWELGNYPDGQGDHPVGGVSWYEAVAYARFRGKSLPTVFHWTRAAVPDNEIASALKASIVPMSNYAGRGSSPVASYQGVGPFGTYDMAGNVREWCWNADPGGSRRAMLGGSSEDPTYLFTHLSFELPFDRSRTNGFRLMRAAPGAGDASDGLLREAVLIPSRTYAGVGPVSDAVFDAYRQQLAYKSGPVDASPMETVSPEDDVAQQENRDWVRRRVEINTGYGPRLQVYFFYPVNSAPPYQPVVYFPEIDPFRRKGRSDTLRPGFPAMPLDFIPRSGRVLVQPVYDGTFERCCLIDQTNMVTLPEAMLHWRWEIGRVLDFLQEAPDFMGSKVGFVGTSFGASYPLPILAVEERFGAAVLLSGGLIQTVVPENADPVNFASRIQVPVLMLNGRYDSVLAKERYQDPLFELLGGPKDREVFETGHGYFPRTDLIRRTVQWFDTHLGAVSPTPPALR